MPQMAPMSWLGLFLMFCMILMIFNLLNLFTFSYSTKTYTPIKMENKVNWKW